MKAVSALSETEFYEACSHFVERLQDVHDGKIAVARVDVLKKGTGKARRKFIGSNHFQNPIMIMITHAPYMDV